MPIKERKFCLYCGSKFERRFIQGRQRLVCTSCGEIFYENPLPASTALVINEQGQLLLGRRGVEPAKGQWCLPGGFIEMGETAQAGALRELKEETGLEGRIIRVIGVASRIDGYWGDVVLIGFEVEITGGELQAGDDAADARYFSMDDMPEVVFDTHRHMLDVIRGEER